MMNNRNASNFIVYVNVKRNVTCTLIHNPRLFILCNVLPQNMNISSHCTIGKHAYGTCLNGYDHFSSLFLCAINVAIVGNSKSKL